MKICNVCGKAMEDNYNVCPYCGRAADFSAENQQNTQPSAAEQNNYQQNQQQSYQAPHVTAAPVNNAEPPEYTPAPKPQRSAYVAAILAVFLGAFGVHNFYLDRKNRALTQLLISVIGAALTFGVATLAMEVWAVVEGLKILKGEINTDGNGNLIKMGL